MLSCDQGDEARREALCLLLRESEQLDVRPVREERAMVADRPTSYEQSRGRAISGPGNEVFSHSFPSRIAFIKSCVCQPGTAHFDHREWPTPGLVLTARSGGRVVGDPAC